MTVRLAGRIRDSAIFAPRNRGMLLDVIVFFVNFFLVRALAGLGRTVTHAAQEDLHAKLVVGLFFAGLLLLQPVGPALRRWSFHQRRSFDTESGAGCLVVWFMPLYVMTMLGISAAASILLTEAFVGGPGGENVALTALLCGAVWSIISAVVIYRYFVKPKQRPRWAFLTTPAAERLGDVAMYANVIGLQVVWASFSASAIFREIVTGTPAGRPGSFTDVLGRLVAIGIVAVFVYIPARLFYLVEDTHRTLTWAAMLLANLPLVLSIALAPPAR